MSNIYSLKVAQLNCLEINFTIFEQHPIDDMLPRNQMFKQHASVEMFIKSYITILHLQCAVGSCETKSDNCIQSHFYLNDSAASQYIK